MVNNEKAKEVINGIYTFWNDNIFNSGTTIESLKLSMEALELQIPMAIEYDEDDSNHCPRCWQHVNTDDHYCKHCGQALYYDINKE